MRTTIELPDDLHRQAKSEAALRGMKFKEYATALFRQGLRGHEDPLVRGRKDPIPVRIPAGRLSFPPGVTNADLFEALEDEEIERMSTIVRERHDRSA